MKFKSLLPFIRRQTTPTTRPTPTTATGPRADDAAPNLVLNADSLVPFNFELPPRVSMTDPTARPRSPVPFFLHPQPEPPTEARTMVNVAQQTGLDVVVRHEEWVIPDGCANKTRDVISQAPDSFRLMPLATELKLKVMSEVMADALKPHATQADRGEAITMTSLSKASNEVFQPELRRQVLNDVIRHGTRADEINPLIGTPAARGPLLRWLQPREQEQAIVAVLRRFHSDGISPMQSIAATIGMGDRMAAALPQESQARILAEVMKDPPPHQVPRFDWLLGEADHVNRGTVLSLEPRHQRGPLMVAVEAAFTHPVVDDEVNAGRQRRIIQAVNSLPAAYGAGLKRRILELAPEFADQFEH